MPLLEVRIEKEKSRAVSAGKVHQVTCRAIGSSPPARISWWKAGERLQATHETVRNIRIQTATITLPSNERRRTDGWEQCYCNCVITTTRTIRLLLRCSCRVGNSSLFSFPKLWWLCAVFWLRHLPQLWWERGWGWWSSSIAWHFQVQMSKAHRQE